VVTDAPTDGSASNTTAATTIIEQRFTKILQRVTRDDGTSRGSQADRMTGLNGR
jgi:hypothetical protein